MLFPCVFFGYFDEMRTPVHAVVPPIAAGRSEGTTSQHAAGFLKHPIDLNDTLEHRQLVERIAQVERDERCVQRVVSVTAGFTALAVVCLGYGLILQPDFGVGASSFVARLISEIALASLISLVGITGFWLVCRGKLNCLMRDCRRLVIQLLECRQELSFGDDLRENSGASETGAAILDTINHTSHAAIRDTAALGGDLAAAATGLVKGAIESAKKMGLNTEEAAAAAADGALKAAGQVGSTAVESVRKAVTRPVNGVKIELKKIESDASWQQRNCQNDYDIQ
jgi:hypothetical protein